jgi:chorismate mutase / prephenate dehydratase
VTTPLPTLAELRTRIDAIDDELHALLRQRADIVHTVRRVKGKQAIFIRPGREASMVRDLVQRPAGRIPPGLVMRLWREMIGAFTMQEGRLQVAVTCGRGELDLWDISRDFYGSSTPLVACKNAAQAVSQVQHGQTELAVVPLPVGGETRPWWRGLVRAPELQVFAQFPFDRADAARCNWRGNRTGAWALARLAPEPTGHDHGLLLVWAPAGASSPRIERTLRAMLHPLTVQRDAQKTTWLVTVAGLLDPAATPYLNCIAALKPLGAAARIIGGYAVPMG